MRRCTGFSPSRASGSARCMMIEGARTRLTDRLDCESGRCGWPCALPAHHGLKLLSDLEVQLCDTLVELALAAILGARRQIKVFLHVAEDFDQLGLGIDHQPQSIKLRLAVPALPATRPHIGYSDPSPWQGTASRIRCTSACAE